MPTLDVPQGEVAVVGGAESDVVEEVVRLANIAPISQFTDEEPSPLLSVDSNFECSGSDSPKFSETEEEYHESADSAI